MQMTLNLKACFDSALLTAIAHLTSCPEVSTYSNLNSNLSFQVNGNFHWNEIILLTENECTRQFSITFCCKQKLIEFRL